MPGFALKVKFSNTLKTHLATKSLKKCIDKGSKKVLELNGSSWTVSERVS